MAKYFRQQRNTFQGIVILGEGLTELWYFKHLKKLFNFRCIVEPRLCQNTCIHDFSRRIDALLSADVTIICVFDADVAGRNEVERQKLNNLRTEYEGNEKVVFCDSLPAIEYWFLLHYDNTCPGFPSTKSAEKDLRKFLPQYKKKESFLQNPEWVRTMSQTTGDYNQAIIRARTFGTVGQSYTNLHKAFEILSETLIR